MGESHSGRSVRGDQQAPKIQCPPKRWFRWSLRTMFVVTTVCGLALFVALVVIPYIDFGWEGHPVSMLKLAKIRKGMMKVDVRKELGNPPTIDDRFPGTIWVYRQEMMWCVVRIRFAEDGTVAEVDHDH